MKKNLLSTTGLLLALALFLLVNIFGGVALRFMRLDLTENGLYTLSDGTRAILSQIDEPVTLRFYFSRQQAADYPHILTYGRRVQELLEEYVGESGGLLTLEVIEPERFSEEEDRAVGYGLTGAQINNAGDRLYFGIVGTNSVDDEQIVPFFDTAREEFLEYDLTELVHNLTTPQKKVVGVLSTLPVRGVTQDPRQMPRPWVFLTQMEKKYEVRDIQPTATEIADDISVLMLVHPKELSDETLFAIDQYVLGGGKVLAFVDPHCDNDPSTGPQGNPMMANKASDITPLMNAWGVEMTPGKLAGDLKGANPIPFEGGRINYVMFYGVKEDGMSPDDIVTGELANVNVVSAGILKKLAGGTTTVEPLLSTSTESMAIDSVKVQFNPNPQEMLDEFIPSGEPLAVAVRVNGPVKTAFPGGKPGSIDPPPGEEPAPATDVLTESVGPINVIIVADADILADGLWARVQNFLGSIMIQPLADNGDFLINSLDNLCGSDDLIGLRSRGRFNRPFDRKVELERAAEDKYREKEQELEAKLANTEAKLAELSQSSGGGTLILSPEQQEEIIKFRDEQLATRKELREVKHQLQKDIDSLGSTLKFLNILLVPLIIGLGAFATWALRSNRR